MRAWFEVGRIDDVPLRGARVVRTAQGEVAVFRSADGAIFALRNRCPHKGGPLSEGIVSGRSVACPLHNWAIDLESGTAKAPDIGCAPPVPVRVVDGTISLELESGLKVVNA